MVESSKNSFEVYQFFFKLMTQKCTFFKYKSNKINNKALEMF